VLYDIEGANERNRVRRLLTKENVLHFLSTRDPEEFVIARGGMKLFTGREFVEEHG
jgi:hypothetical protein